jgi:hypothetical protein
VAAFLFANRQPEWSSAILVALIAAGAVGVFDGAHQDPVRQRRSSLGVLWLAVGLQTVAAVLSALSPIVIAVGLLTITTALLRTFKSK